MHASRRKISNKVGVWPCAAPAKHTHEDGNPPTWNFHHKEFFVLWAHDPNHLGDGRWSATAIPGAWDPLIDKAPQAGWKERSTLPGNTSWQTLCAPWIEGNCPGESIPVPQWLPQSCPRVPMGCKDPTADSGSHPDDASWGHP